MRLEKNVYVYGRVTLVAQFRFDRIVSARIRRSYVTRARIALLTAASIRSKYASVVLMLEKKGCEMKCLRAISDRAIHFVPTE